MPINTFSEKATKYLAILDEIYKRGSLTTILDNPAFAAQFVGTNKIKLPKVSVDGAANYNRDSGYSQGGVNVSYEEHELKYDRGRKFRIDVIDNDESAFDLYRTVAAEYVRTSEVPEMDAIRFAEIFAAAQKGGTVVQKDIADSDSAFNLFDVAEMTLNEAEVPEEGRVLFCSNAFYMALKNDSAMSRRIDVNGNNGNIDRRVATLDGVTPIIRVPSARFMTEIQLNDGETEGQKDGGFTYITGTTKNINFIYGSLASMKGGAVKRNISKIVMPNENQFADAYDIFYRTHHDLIIPENRAKGIYVHTAATARE